MMEDKRHVFLFGVNYDVLDSSYKNYELFCTDNDGNACYCCNYDNQVSVITVKPNSGFNYTQNGADDDESAMTMLITSFTEWVASVIDDAATIIFKIAISSNDLLVKKIISGDYSVSTILKDKISDDVTVPRTHIVINSNQSITIKSVESLNEIRFPNITGLDTDWISIRKIMDFRDEVLSTFRHTNLRGNV